MDTFSVEDPGDVAGDRLRRERRREREFYKYYEPICGLSPWNPSHVNLFDKAAAARHVPRSSPDRSLTAFCQLGALRLEARRCLLFFFDCDYAYVLAESTRTLSLVDDNTYEAQDGLWLGNVVIPRGLSVCEHTVNIPEANLGSNKDHKNAGIVHIINNLQDDTRFCDRPFVTEGPLARFYAGVPIITPNGHRIGAFCILDDKPRDGLSDKDVSFLCQMGETVMYHIETVRSRAEFSRGSRMLTSMESFFSSAPAMAATSRKTSLMPDSSENDRSNLDAVVVRKPEYFGKTSSRRNSLAEPQSVDSSIGSAMPSGGVEAAALPSTDEKAVTLPAVDGAVECGPRISPAADELDVALEHSVKTTFGVAATLIRSATDVDGMIFLDIAAQARRTPNGATRLSHGGDSDVDSVHGFTENTSTDGGRTTDTDREEKAVIPPNCPVLGASVYTQRTGQEPLVNQVPSKLMRSLLRRYPAGKVWYFDNDGDSFCGDTSSDHTTTLLSSNSSQHSDHSEQRDKPRRSKARESREIQQLFPGVRALGIIQLWDHTKNRIYAGGIIWTCSPVRILTAEGDLGFLRAFSDVIMSNVARLTSRMEDQAKSDFISSISHELRSPLHGILGSIDFLQEQATVDQSIVTQIERCSVTLMDVIEHLLEFAKINNLSHSHTNAGQGSRVRAWLHNSTHTHDRVQSLTKLTEEVADATFYSHCCNLEVKDHGIVAFVLDVASDHLDDFKVPVGAWKRLCINIINNALKYTAKGHVSVSLKASHRPRKRSVAILTVTDTGRGMSRDFLEHRLFKAFSQEDSLANGTGLGMSLVAKLVRNMAGKIEVQSTKNVGTTIKISIPIETRDTPIRLPTHQTTCRIKLPRASSDTDIIKRNDRTLQHTALDRACRNIGADPVEDNADITMLLESDLSQVLANEDLKRSVEAKPVILLCTSFASAATLKHSALAKALDCHIEFIPQPYGPQRLAEAVKKCLAAKSAHDNSMPTAPQTVSASPDDIDLVEAMRTNTLTGPIEGLHQDIEKFHPLRRHSRRDLFPLDIQPAPTDDSTIAGAGLVETPTSTKSLTLPRQAKRSVSSEHGTLADGHEDDQPLSLLIVDDNQINVRVLMTFADRNNHPRLTATNGEEAVQAYQNAASPAVQSRDEQGRPVAKPDVVLMDLQMPVCDGWEATRRIRALEKSQSIPRATIIALTGLGSSDAHQEARAAGIDIFLTKPVRPKDLRPLLESVERGMRENARASRLT